MLSISSQCEENTSLADCSRYLKLPFSKANVPSNNQTLKGTKESFWITSFLCSTKLTQNGKPDSGIDLCSSDAKGQIDLQQAVNIQKEVIGELTHTNCKHIDRLVISQKPHFRLNRI